MQLPSRLRAFWPDSLFSLTDPLGVLPGIAAAVVLWLASASGAAANPTATPDIPAEIECLALNIYFEARGESDLGKRAVGHVVLNRVSDPTFPDTVCDVVRQGGSKARMRCQFSWWCDGRSDRPAERQAWERSKAIARKVFWGLSDDPTLGAMWYHTAAVKPSWRDKLLRGPAIESHVFYLKEVPAKIPAGLRRWF